MKELRIPVGLLLVLIAIFLIRIPSFFEPYWYGDEGIYLVLGQEIRRGATLYKEIWDNKPPLLYLIYAIYPTLVFAKVTATVFVLGTVASVYALASKIIPRKGQAFLTALAVGILLSLPYPLLEGLIANAELYFNLPVIVAAILIYNSLRSNGYQLKSWLSVGVLTASAFLIKVPAVFDIAGMLLAVWIVTVTSSKAQIRTVINQTGLLVRRVILPVTVGFLIPVGATFLYFFLNGALSDFLVAVFSQNAAYVEVDSGPLAKLSNPLIIKGLILFFSSAILGFLFWKKKISRELLFLALWFGFSLYGALLSNRAYPHYLLEVVPVGVILTTYLISQGKKYLWVGIALTVLTIYLLKAFNYNWASVRTKYYQNWFDYVSERMMWREFAREFDSDVPKTYEVARFISENSSPDERIFVWGDASFIYVLSERRPETRFIQAHHLSTIDPVNYDLIIQRLTRQKTKFILIYRPVRFTFPKLEELVKKSYDQVAVFDNVDVYQLQK